MNQSLQQILGGGFGNALSQYGGMYPVRDSRPAKEILTEKLAHNENVIKSYQSENDKIREALSLIDEHPMIARLQDLLRHILG